MLENGGHYFNNLDGIILMLKDTSIQVSMSIHLDKRKKSL